MKRLTKQELQRRLQKRGKPVTGTVAQLRKRLGLRALKTTKGSRYGQDSQEELRRRYDNGSVEDSQRVHTFKTRTINIGDFTFTFSHVQILKQRVNGEVRELGQEARAVNDDETKTLYFYSNETWSTSQYFVNTHNNHEIFEKTLYELAKFVHATTIRFEPVTAYFTRWKMDEVFIVRLRRLGAEVTFSGNTMYAKLLVDKMGAFLLARHLHSLLSNSTMTVAQCEELENLMPSLMSTLRPYLPDIVEQYPRMRNIEAAAQLAIRHCSDPETKVGRKRLFDDMAGVGLRGGDE